MISSATSNAEIPEETVEPGPTNGSVSTRNPDSLPSSPAGEKRHCWLKARYGPPDQTGLFRRRSVKKNPLRSVRSETRTSRGAAFTFRSEEHTSELQYS